MVTSLRADVSIQVDVSLAVGQPRIFSHEASVKSVRVPFHPAHSGFPQIIHGGPDKVTDAVFMLQNGLPVIIQPERMDFRPHNHPVRMFDGIQSVTRPDIIITRQIQLLPGIRRLLIPIVLPVDHTRRFLDRSLQLLKGFIRGHSQDFQIQHTMLSHGNRPIRIQTSGTGRQLLQDGKPLPASGELRDFISHRPGKNAGMIPIPENHGAQIPLPPFGKKAVVIVFRLSFFPAVESLLQNQHSHSVAEIQKGEGNRIMGRAHRVKSLPLQNGKLPSLRRRIGAGTEAGVIMMNAAAPQLHASAV